MSTSLNVSKSPVDDFLKTAKKNRFVIPEYQRPYSWEEEQVLALFDDIWDFSIQNANDESKFYFLGTIVSFVNENGEMEIIDGQQRITTLFLLLRVIYEKLKKSEEDEKVRSNLLGKIEPLIFKADRKTGTVDLDSPLLISRVISEDEVQPLLHILATGIADTEATDHYSKNYCLLEKRLEEKCSRAITHFPDFVLGIIEQTIVLPITADNMDTALQIFQTLNDRGLPLSDADIFKANMYKSCSLQERKHFIDEWIELDRDATHNQESIQKLFYYYMFYLRASVGDTDTTTLGLRKFYLDDKKKRLTQPNLLNNIRTSLNLWRVVNSHQTVENEPWSANPGIQKALDTLCSYPNEFWKYPVVIFYLKYRNEVNFEESFKVFLNKLCGTLLAEYLLSPTLNSVKGPILKLNAQIYQSSHPTFESFTPNIQIEDERIFKPHRKLERMLLKVMAYSDEQQTKLLPDSWEIEHIFPRSWDDHYFDDSYSIEFINERIEHIGNKTPFEKKLNIKASNGYFSRKQKEYENSHIVVTKKMSDTKFKKDWDIEDIILRGGEVAETIKTTMQRWNKEYAEANKQEGRSFKVLVTPDAVSQYLSDRVLKVGDTISLPSFYSVCEKPELHSYATLICFGKDEVPSGQTKSYKSGNFVIQTIEICIGDPGYAMISSVEDIDIKKLLTNNLPIFGIVFKIVELV